MESAARPASDANPGGSTTANLQYALHGFSGANSNMAHSFGDPQAKSGEGRMPRTRKRNVPEGRMPRRDSRRALRRGAGGWTPARAAPAPSPAGVLRPGGPSQVRTPLPVPAPAGGVSVRRQPGGRASGPARAPGHPGPPRIRSNRCSTGIWRTDGCRTHPWYSARRSGWTLLRKYYTQRA